MTFTDNNDVLQNSGGDNGDGVVIILPFAHNLNLVSCTYVDKWFRELFTLHTQQVIKTFDSLFFYTYRLVLHGQSVLQFSKLLFMLANHRSQACSAFDRILAKTTCQKCKRGKLEVIRMQIIFIMSA